VSNGTLSPAGSCPPIRLACLPADPASDIQLACRATPIRANLPTPARQQATEENDRTARKTQPTAQAVGSDCARLLPVLAAVPDPRARRGVLANLAITVLRLTGQPSIAAALRYHARRPGRSRRS